MTGDDNTLAGYLSVHGRPPAFGGSDGRSYTVGIVSDDDPGPDGRFGAALLFVRWSEHQAPDGHLETGYLTFGETPSRAEEQLGRMTLREVKAALDSLLARTHTGH